MDQPAGQHGNAAVFAANGAARHRLMRVAVAAGFALLASWLIALGLGVLGGFDSLPGLPGSQSRDSNAVSTQSRMPHVSGSRAAQPQEGRAAPSVRSSSPATVNPIPIRTQSPSPTSKTTSRTVIRPSTSTAAGSTSNGHGQGPIRTTTGKPAGSPGAAPGGSGAPGQLR